MLGASNYGHELQSKTVHKIDKDEIQRKIISFRYYLKYESPSTF